MSFTEKIAGLLAQQNQQDSMQPDAPWYMKHGGRVLGIVGAFFAILFGLYNALGIIFFNVKCLISGILQMLLGFTVMSLEAPFCFFCIGFVKTMAETVDRGPMWRKAAGYCGLSLIPIILCPGLGSLFGCGLIFGTGVIYGMMSLGKKASAEEMRQAAINAGLSGGATPNPTTNDRASIVKNAQPFSFTGAVGTDSNV